jgi:hypothetical protein
LWQRALSFLDSTVRMKVYVVEMAFTARSMLLKSMVCTWYRTCAAIVLLVHSAINSIFKDEKVVEKEYVVRPTHV